MSWKAALASLVTSSALLLAACGSSAPSEATIYYDPALRPGVVEASDTEHELLARLGETETAQTLAIGDRVYVAEEPYAAASGRRCRSVRVRTAETERARLACEADGGWVFVPDVLGAGDGP